jgi:hypothetical protein
MAAPGATMDLTTAAVNFQQGKTLAAVQISVARKVMDMQEMQGAAMVKLIEAAGKTAGDALVAAATGLGGGIDTYG